jgi:hypothetical protein
MTGATWVAPAFPRLLRQQIAMDLRIPALISLLFVVPLGADLPRPGDGPTIALNQLKRLDPPEAEGWARALTLDRASP